MFLLALIISKSIKNVSLYIYTISALSELIQLFLLLPRCEIVETVHKEYVFLSLYLLKNPAPTKATTIEVIEVSNTSKNFYKIHFLLY